MTCAFFASLIATRVSKTYSPKNLHADKYKRLHKQNKPAFAHSFKSLKAIVAATLSQPTYRAATRHSGHGGYTRAPPTPGAQVDVAESGLLQSWKKGSSQSRCSAHACQHSPGVCDGWFNLWCIDGSTHHRSYRVTMPQSNRPDSGQMRLLKPAIIHGHLSQLYFYLKEKHYYRYLYVVFRHFSHLYPGSKPYK